jgi:long-chain acyl-CoA synthetase
VIGNQQKYLVALIALEEDVLQGLASERGWSGGFRDWIQEKEVQNWIKERVDGANTQLAGFEQLKKYSVIQKPLTEDDGLLTSTQKLKKKAVIERYQALWQKLY